MNYIIHLNRFYARLPHEPSFTARHIALYLALFHCWNDHRFTNPFPLIRERVMQLSGIRCKDSYMKCLKDLHRSGYIIYSPPLHKYHRPKASIVELKVPSDFVPLPSLFKGKDEHTPAPSPENTPETGTVPVPDSSSILVKIDALSVPVSGHQLQTNPNNVNRERETRTQYPILNTHMGIETGTPPAAENASPSLEEVQAYFSQTAYPEAEAQLFFNHYEATGWKLGGKAPITNWQAAARKWMDYAKNFKTKQDEKPRKYHGTEHLHVEQNKDYSQPL